MSIKEGKESIINDSTLVNVNIIDRIIKEGKNYGRSNYGNNKKISISYISCNNNFDIRKIIYEDSLANILSFAGYDVTREYYCNCSYLDVYKKELDGIRVSFDCSTSEESLNNQGIVDNTLNSLQKSGKCYIDDDSLWIKTTDLYDSKDRILVNSDGTYTSFLLDVSYRLNRLSKGYDKVIDVISSNDYEYIDGIRSCIEIAGYASSEYEIINISNYYIYNDNKEYNDLKELMNEIDVNKIRYIFINEYFNNELNIDLELVKKDDENNLIYFIEYAYDRVCYVLRCKSYKKDNTYGTIDSNSAYTILNKLTLFENAIIDSVVKRQPNIIASYLYELACLFNYYYNDITDNNRYINEGLIKAIRIVMDSTSNMLGIILREEM